MEAEVSGVSPSTVSRILNGTVVVSTCPVRRVGAGFCQNPIGSSIQPDQRACTQERESMKRALTQGLTVAMVLTASLHAPLASAGVHCTEKISQAILHENGDIYFQTDNTCNGAWCQIKWGTPEKNKNALAMLLSAKVADRSITFYWNGLTTCSEKNPVYTSPGYMMLN